MDPGAACYRIALCRNGAGTEREESEREPTRRRLAALFAAISSEITDRFTDTLAVAGANFEDN